MAINFYCPVCNAPIRGLPDSAAGRHGICLKCGSRIPVHRRRRVNEDDIVAILGPVKKDVEPLAASADTVSDCQTGQIRKTHAEQNAVEESDAGDTQAMDRSGGDRSIISRSREFLRSMVSRVLRFDLHSIRRRKQLRPMLRHDERFIVESDQMVLTNQRLLNLTSHDVLDLNQIDSAFASDSKTSSDLILHCKCERHVFARLERHFVHTAVESIRTMLSVEPGVPTLPKAARETSDLFDVAFGPAVSKEQRSHSFKSTGTGGYAASTPGEGTPAAATAERTIKLPQASSHSAERARRSAMKKLRRRGYRMESYQESERVVRAMRNCDVACLSRLATDQGNKALRCDALAALRDLGSQAAGAMPALRRLLDSDELRITKEDASKEDLQFLTVVSETYLAVSNDRR